jgi:hypothetical protein
MDKKLRERLREKNHLHPAKFNAASVACAHRCAGLQRWAYQEHPLSMEVFIMKKAIAVFVAALLTSCSSWAVDVGLVDQKPPTREDLVAPKSDEGIAVVSLRAIVKGKVPKGEKRHLYVAVSPRSNPTNVNQWWIQQAVVRNGDAFSAEAQFGEGETGIGEYFAIVGIALANNLSVNERLDGLPEDAVYSKVKIVKRK